MFYLVGIGLGGYQDITIRGLAILKSSDEVYMDAYTSIWCDSTDKLSNKINKQIQLVNRHVTESNIDNILLKARYVDISYIVVGDPLSATTHTDILLRAKSLDVKTQIVHNTSILTAIGSTGLQLYRFGETVSIVQWTDKWEPDSFYHKIVQNYTRNLHTLCLLDIKLNELTIKAILKNQEIYAPNYFQSAKEAALILIEISKRLHKQNLSSQSDTLSVLPLDATCVVCSRLGWPDEKISFLPLQQLAEINEELIGSLPQSLIITANALHPCEQEFLKEFSNNLSLTM